MASSSFNRPTEVIYKAYTLTYYGANSLRADPIDIPAGCNIHRMVILPPGYNGVSLKGTNFQIIAEKGIGYFGSGFTSTDTMQVTCAFFL